MRYHYKKPKNYITLYGEIYICNHPVYDRCTLFKIGSKGISVIQQRFDSKSKHTFWTEIDPWIANDIYTNPRFKEYFDSNAEEERNGLFPTVTVRKIMWSLKMKPIPKERWETVFDRRKV